MSTNHTAFSKIVHLAKPGATLIRHYALEGGVSANMYALEFETGQGEQQKIVVRQHRDDDWKHHPNHVTSVEFGLLEMLFKHGFKVAEPLYLDNSAEVLSSPYLVSSFVMGSSTVSKTELNSCLKQMAGFLTRLHNSDLSGLDQISLPSQEDPVAGALRYLPKVSQDQALIDAVAVNQANTKMSHLLHGDFWPGNLLWQDGLLQAVIDWEDASLGNPMADLACARVELLCQYDRQAMDYFTGDYLAKNTFDTDDLVLWEIYAASAALANMGNWGLPTETESQRRKMTKMFLEQAAARLIGNST